jgi:outer membrane cobalamin receptor
MMDGQPFNDLLYQGVALGNHFPVDAIQRIEIIRGPGSALYGGSAEYGVVNIVTKSETLNGVQVYGIGGFHQKATGRTNTGFMVARNTSKVSWDISLFKGKGIVSDQTYTSLYQDTVDVDLAKATYADPLNLNAGLRIGNFHFRTMYDQFETNEPPSFISFRNFFADAKYEWKVNPKFTLTPQLKYYNQIPWQYGYYGDEGDYFKARAERYSGSLQGSYDITRKININAGGIYFTDKATDLLKTDYFQGSNTISFNNLALFAQALFKHRLANATIGFRYEKNNQYGSAFVPRLGLTKKIENFHFKVLFSQAFRAPSIENINGAEEGIKIKPEKSNVFEVELGYQFTPEMLLAVNAFSLETRDVIIYGYSLDNPDGVYENFDKTGSYGMELVYSIRKKRWYSQLTYSFSQASSANTVDTYTLPQTSKQFVGMAAHKVTLNTNFSITQNLTLNPTFIASGPRYAYTRTETIDEDEDGFPDVDESGDEIHVPVTTKLSPYVLANIFLNYRNVVPGLTAGIGVFDIFNETPDVPQAYNGDYAPIPGRSREFVVKLSYQIDFKK